MSSKLTSLKEKPKESVMLCYTIVHDTAGKNNPLQLFSSFQESVLLYLLNTQS